MGILKWVDDIEIYQIFYILFIGISLLAAAVVIDLNIIPLLNLSGNASASAAIINLQIYTKIAGFVFIIIAGLIMAFVTFS